MILAVVIHIWTVGQMRSRATRENPKVLRVPPLPRTASTRAEHRRAGATVKGLSKLVGRYETWLANAKPDCLALSCLG